MPVFHTSPYATEQLWEGPKGLRGTMRRCTKSSVEAVAAGSAKCTQGAAVVDEVGLAHLEYVAVLDFVLHRVIICHDSAHDGIPVKKQNAFCYFMQNDLFTIRLVYFYF